MKNLNSTLQIIMVLFLAFTFVSMRCENAALKEQLAQGNALTLDVLTGLDGIPVFEPDVKSLVAIRGTQATIINRLDDMQVEMEQLFIPQEGGVQVTYVLDSLVMDEYTLTLMEFQRAVEAGDSTRTAELDIILRDLWWSLYQPEINAQTSGFCVAPQMGVAIDDNSDLPLSIGSRLYFNGHWGAGAEFTGASMSNLDSAKVGLGPYIDYRGFISGLDNLSFGVGASRQFDFAKSGWFWAYRAGIHTYF